MYRYFVVIWNRSDTQAGVDAALVCSRLQASSPEWQVVLDAPGMKALHAGADNAAPIARRSATSCETRSLSPPGRGVIFGRVFERGREGAPHEPNASVDPGESDRICATGGLHLIQRYWGRYIAVFASAPAGAVNVIRDPTGGIPCFITRYRGVWIVFSDVESCVALGLLEFSINWRYVEVIVPYPALQVRETGLNEITELHAGERATFNGDAIDYRLVWKPSDFAGGDRILDPTRATREVRRTVDSCVHAWTSLHRSVIHNLSGGLDSSIVLSSLKRSPNHPHVTCVHFFSSTTDEDEREHARLVARHFDTELAEFELDPRGANLEALERIRPAPRPWFYIYDLVHGPLEAKAAAACNATGAFSGGGGDGLFVQARADLAVADYLRHFGPRPGVVSVALDAARITRESIWTMLGRGIARYRRTVSRNPLSEFGEGRSLIPSRVMERVRSDESLVHPWIREAGELTPGQLWHILCLSVPPQFYDSFGEANAVERTPVLVSQPLVELCLRIPTYVWIVGGRDRSIARRAYADELPAAITRRTQKGLLDRYNRVMLDDNAAFVRDMLIDGMLVNAGMLDRPMLQRFLDPVSPPESLEYNDVLRQHLCTEVWLRRWRALTTSSAR